VIGWRDGPGLTAQFHDPISVTYNRDGSAILVAERVNKFLRRIDVSSGNVSTVAGTGVYGSVDGPATTASFRGLVDVESSMLGDRFVMADLDEGPSKDSSVRLMMRKVCGDGRTEGSEGCDGGPLGVVGCTLGCAVEAGWRCWNSCGMTCTSNQFPSQVGVRVQGSGYRVQCSVFSVHCSGFRV